MRKLTFIIVSQFFLALFSNNVNAQTNPRFNIISNADFARTIAPVTDSSNDAIIIADAGVTTFKGNSKGWIDYVYKRTTRVKILNKRAFYLATVKVPLYTGSSGKVTFDNVSATTYNLEDGKVVQNKLAKTDIFTDIVNKYYSEYRFTLPAVKENCIIEYSYTVTSSLFQYIPSWKFQSFNYPCLWSEYEITIPDLVVYLITKRGLHSYFVNESVDGRERYMIKESQDQSLAVEGGQLLSVSTNTKKHHWVIRNLPAFTNESYISSPENYIDKIDFQLYQVFNGVDTYNGRNSWSAYVNEMLAADYFASFMSDPEKRGWLEKPMAAIATSAEDKMQQAKDIYYYLTERFSCISRRQFYVNTSLQDVFKNQQGNAGEINLLLTEMLLTKNITAAPVVLSTRDQGYNNANYPMLERLNYVVCKATIGDKAYYLDASCPGLGFGHLPEYCYNGYARVISKIDTAGYIFFSADSVKEWKNSFVSIYNDSLKKGKLYGTYENSPGGIESYTLRQSIKESGEKKYFEEMQASLANEIKITESSTESLKNSDGALKLHASFNIQAPNEGDMFYFNPFFIGGYKSNPFNAAVRQYPVELSYPINEVYVLSMEIPSGFVVDELPVSTKLLFNGGEGSFEYLVQKDEDGIHLKSIIKMNKAYFDPEEYNALRDFFTNIVKKQSEQIIFKKKK